MERVLKRRKQQICNELIFGIPRELPNELVFGILRRLPAKALVRFKCVCKAWKSFVSEIRYDNQKLILSSSYSIQSIDLEASEIKAVQLGFPVNIPHGFKIIGSCNGLLCIATRKEGFLLWNPWTGRYKKIPVPSPLENFWDTMGLGYDVSTDDYKIVRVVYEGKCPVLFGNLVEIYSLNSNSWHKVHLPCQIISICGSHSGTFVNGSIHWPIRNVRNFEPYKGGLAFSTDEIGDAILHYELKDQRFNVIQPPAVLGKKFEFSLGDFGGRLCLFHYHHEGHIDMWAREEQEWIKMMSIPCLEEEEISSLCNQLNPVRLRNGVSGEVPLKYFLKPICFVKSGELLMKMKRTIVRLSQIDVIGKNFCLYSPVEKTFRKFELYTAPNFREEIIYTQSLISPIRYCGEKRLTQEVEKLAADISHKSA